GVEWGSPKSEGAPMTSPQKIESITLQIAKCAALLDSKAPGWAHRVPIGEVNVADVRKSPLALNIGPHWETVITSKSAVEMGALRLNSYTSKDDAANRARHCQLPTRRVTTHTLLTLWPAHLPT